MNPKLDTVLKRWEAARVVDAATAERIRAYEVEQGKSAGMRWPVILAISMGGLLLCAGVLLFVEAHWDVLSPAERFSLVLLLVAAFHAGGAVTAERLAVLSSVLHTTGTAALGAGIFLAGQIFNLEEHWPGGFLLWALGAWLGWLVLRDWPQLLLAAILTPVWLAGEWDVRAGMYMGNERVASQSLLLLAITYFTVRPADQSSAIRRALMWLGGLALIPATFVAAERWWGGHYEARGSAAVLVVGWVVGFGLPLALAYWLRGRGAWMNLVAAFWVVVLGTMGTTSETDAARNLFLYFWREAGVYLWCGLGSIAMVAWGLKEFRRERINMGVAGVALTVVVYYFANVLDKLGRSISLIGFGALFLVGGWVLERTRRRLMARLNAARQA